MIVAGSTDMADGIPNEKGFFLGLAQAPLHFHNLVAELIDNAVAAKEQGFKIAVDMSEPPAHAGQYAITVVDNGPGISLTRLKGNVFKTGEPPLTGSPHLNEHGFGLKNVLAKTEALGGEWSVRTRDKSVLKSAFYETHSPLSFKIPIHPKAPSDWPAYGSAETGTIVQLMLPFTYLQTVSRGRRGAPPGTPPNVLKYLREHLGVFYRGYIKGTPKTGSIFTSLGWGNAEEVEPISPDYSSKEVVKKFVVKTSVGTLEIEGEYGLLATSSQATRRERVYYYRNSSESQGIDIRIGKRIVATRLLTEIWERARHPSYNALWGEFRVQPAIPGQIPKTLNNKTAIDFDNEIWQTLAEGIRQQVPEKDLPKGGEGKQEADLRHELRQQLDAFKLENDIVEENYPCFGGSGVVIDVFRDESVRTHELFVYETKSGQAHPLDVYQLRMYWDGLVEDGKQPTRAYLVAETKTTGVSALINFVNSRNDKNDKPYRFEFKTWSDLNIQP